MKRKTFILLLVCEAVLLLLLSFLTNQFPKLFSSMLAFPFEQIAVALKALSQTGQIGNGLAAALWIGISLLPLIPALRRQQNKIAIEERISLYLLSCILPLALYGMMNPHVFCPLLSETGNEYMAIVIAVIGVTLWSVILLCIILRLIRVLRSGDKASLLRYTRRLLYILCLLFSAAAAISLGSGLSASAGSSPTALDSMINILRSAVTSVPYVLDIAIIISTLNLFDIAMTEEQSGIVNAAERLSKVCFLSLGVTTALSAVFNVLQVLLMRWLSNVATTVNIPIMSIVFVGIVLLLSRLLAENKRLRDDNSLFI